MLAEMYPGVDWVLVEGFNHSDLLKLEVWRHETGHPATYPDDDFVVGIVTNSPDQLPSATLRPVLDLNRSDNGGAMVDRSSGPFSLQPF